MARENRYFPLMDTLTIEERSRRMGLIRGKGTKPELALRKLVFSLGYRYRLHQAKLPGKPDLVFPGRKKVIFIHGCFWHRHIGCKNTRWPKSKLDFWKPKLLGNARRDKRKMAELVEMGWTPLVIWECELRDVEHLTNMIKTFLGRLK
jgi:DNA mismatch endonuclease (patch repair protein)